jgi:hypothetical protein
MIGSKQGQLELDFKQSNMVDYKDYTIFVSLQTCSKRLIPKNSMKQFKIQSYGIKQSLFFDSTLYAWVF